MFGKTDRIFIKILPKVYLWTRKSPLNCGSHPDPTSDWGSGICVHTPDVHQIRLSRRSALSKCFCFRCIYFILFYFYFNVKIDKTFDCTLNTWAWYGVLKILVNRNIKFLYISISPYFNISTKCTNLSGLQICRNWIRFNVPPHGSAAAGATWAMPPRQIKKYLVGLAQCIWPTHQIHYRS